MGTIGIIQDRPREKYGHCDLRFINQARPGTDGKEEVTENISGAKSSAGHKVRSWDDYLVRPLACHIAISLTSIILWFQRQVLTSPISYWHLNMLRMGESFRVNGGQAWAWPFSPILVELYLPVTGVMQNGFGFLVAHSLTNQHVWNIIDNKYAESEILGVVIQLPWQIIYNSICDRTQRMSKLISLFTNSSC